jgi:hypothetical protein
MGMGCMLWLAARALWQCCCYMRLFALLVMWAGKVLPDPASLSMHCRAPVLTAWRLLLLCLVPQNFAEHTSATRSIQALHGTKVGDKLLHVSLQTPRLRAAAMNAMM